MTLFCYVFLVKVGFYSVCTFLCVTHSAEKCNQADERMKTALVKQLKVDPPSQCVRSTLTDEVAMVVRSAAAALLRKADSIPEARRQQLLSHIVAYLKSNGEQALHFASDCQDDQNNNELGVKRSTLASLAKLEVKV
jgi:hypothetical protein